MGELTLEERFSREVLEMPVIDPAGRRLRPGGRIFFQIRGKSFLGIFLIFLKPISLFEKRRERRAKSSFASPSYIEVAIGQRVSF